MSLIDDFFNDRQSAREAVVGLEDNNPDEAARAIELSRITGVPSVAVVNDIPSFEKQARDTLATDIINDNPALQEYINSNPMAARISSDDWGNLDSITRRTGDLPWYKQIPAVSHTLALGRATGKYFEGMKEQGHIGSWLYNTPEKAEWAATQPRSTLVALSMLGLPFDLISRVFGPIPGAAKQFVTETYADATGDQFTAERLGRETAGFIEYVFNKPPVASGPGPTSAVLANRELRALADSTGPYLRAGVEPPVGLNPMLDNLKKEQAKSDLEELADLTREVQQSTTRARSPEMFADLLRQQTQANIYIPFDAIVRIYGDKPIKPDDGILGWVPGIQEQVRTMSMTGGDIVIPLADWLAKSDKAVAKDLHDNIRVRRGGFTLEEAKEFDEVRREMADVEVFHGSPHSFDAFSMEAIGTGEGAQSYGHGLYFAENRAVAETYNTAGQVRGDPKWTINGRQVSAFGIGTYDNAATVEAAVAYRMHTAKDRAEAVAIQERMAAKTKDQFDLDVAEVLRSGAIEPPLPPPQGNLYRARIRANPEEFLDWDKPLGQQTDRIRQGIQATFEGAVNALEFANISIGDSLGKRFQDPAIAKKAKEAGIPGIRYLDQGSRQRTKAEIQEDIRNVKLDIGQTKLPELVDEIEKRTGMDIVKYRSQLENKLEDLQRQLEGAPQKQTYNYVLFDDSLVEILDRNGEAVNAVRAQAALEPLETPPGWQTVEPTPRIPIEGEEVRYYSPTTKAYVLPKEKWHQIEKIIETEVQRVLDRIAPGAEAHGVQEIERKGTSPRGVFISRSNATPLILWSLESPDPFATARHEAIHYLRDQGFFTTQEWDILKAAAIEGDWINKYNIDTRYHDATPELKLEEAIAEEYSKGWAKGDRNVKDALKRVFEKLHILLVEIKEAIQKALGYEPKAEELFAMVESGEVGARTGTAPLPVDVLEGRIGVKREAEARPEQGELDVTRQEDKAIFQKASAIGMTIPQYKRYLELIAKRNLEDIQAQRERAIAFEKKRQSAEWRQESEAIEDEVRADLRNRPDIAAIEFLRYGELYGQKIEGRKPQLNPEFLTPEQRAMLPEQWLSDKGLHPDDAAGLFGYSSGAELVERLAAHEAARGNIRPGEFFARQVKAEVERRMVEKYGELDANVLSAAEDHVLGITQMDLLHEETVALGSRSGAQISFSKEDVQAWAGARFNESLASKVSAVRFLDEAGKAGRAAELALLKGDFAEAFRQKQRQYLSVLMAKEAKAFEKETQRFERLATRFSRREGPKAVEQEFTDQIQALLLRAELPVRRTGEELQEAFDRAGYRNLEAFTQAQQADGYDLAVHPSMFNPIKAADAMSVEETRYFRSSIQSLNHVGREVKQIEVAGAKEEFDAYREKVVNAIKTLPRIPRKQNPIAKWFFGWDSELTKMEEMVKDLDLRQDAGPLWDVLIRPMAEAKHTEYAMMEELSKRFRDMQVGSKEWQKTLNDTIPQNFFFTPDGLLFDMSRSDMIGIMLNFGNKSNIEKFTKAWAGKDVDPTIFEQKLRALFDQNAKKEDWDFVQSMWDIFEMWRPQANEMYYQLSGVPPKWIDPQPFSNAHGNYRGGYFPIIFDREWSKVPAKDAANINPDSVFGNYHRSTPVNHYTTERTGYIDYIDFQDAVDTVPMRMQQEIHDIAYRRQIIEAKKVISDPSIRAAIRHHYGPQYEAQLKPWLQKIASQYNDNPELRHFTGAVRRARYNLVAHALGANLRVILSPDVGTLNLKVLWDTYKDPATNWKFANENSKEIPHTFHNMDRDFRERLEQTIKAEGWDKFRADAARWAFAPAVYFSQVFRVATWTSEYKANMAKGMSEGEAVSLADSKVRERHGAAGIADLPALMTQGEGWKMWTMFYGFFNTMYNWQRQIPGAARRGDMKGLAKALWGSILVPAAFGALLFNQQKESDSWGKTIAKALLLQPLSTVPFLRDAAQLYSEGYSSRSPIASILQATYSLGQDVVKYTQNKKVNKPITHTANVVGLGLGLPLAQIGRTTQFGVDVYQGKQRPRNVPEWIRGIISGEARLKK